MFSIVVSLGLRYLGFLFVMICVVICVLVVRVIFLVGFSMVSVVV